MTDAPKTEPRRPLENLVLAEKTLGDLEREAQAESVLAPGAVPGQDPAPQVQHPQQATPEMVAVCSAGMAVVGAIVTKRAGVSDLTPDEVKSLGQATAQVAAQYNFGDLDPKAAAWLGLGMAVIGCAVPRLDEIKKADPGDVKPPPPGLGDPGQAAKSVTPENEPGPDGVITKGDLG